MENTIPIASPNRSNHERFEILDGLRGVAAILVMFHHYLGGYGLWSVSVQNYQFIFLFSGPLAVDFFFVLSGFVLSAAYGRRIGAGMRFWAYFLRRLIRVYPMYAIGMVVGTSAFFLTSHVLGAPIQSRNFVASALVNFALIPDYIGQFTLQVGTDLRVPGPFPLDPPGWSLFCELFVSATFVALFPRSKSFLAMLVLLSVAIIVVVELSQQHHAHHRLQIDMNVGSWRDTLWLGMLRAVAGFYLGVLIYRIRTEQTWFQRAPFDWNVQPIRLYALLSLCLICPFQVRGILPLAFLFVASPLLVIWGAEIRHMPPRIERLSVWLGRISFPLYCVHFPIGQIVWVVGGQLGLSLWLDAVVAAILSFGIAFLACVHLDEPVRKFLTQAIFLRKAAANPAFERDASARPTIGEVPPAP